MPLNGNTLPYVPPTADSQQQIAAINRIIDIINAFQQQIVFADDKSKRMLIGYQKDGWGPGNNFGIKVSIPGIDVTAATDAQLLLKFDLQTWFYYQNGVNIGQVGVLPDSTTGEAWAKSGQSVPAAFS